MAGKYNLFLVLGLVVACFARELPSRPYSISLMSQPTEESPVSNNEFTTLDLGEATDSGGVSSTAVTTTTPTAGGASSEDTTTETPGSGGVPSAAVTTKTPGSGGVPSAAVTTKTPGSGGVPSAAVTTKTPGSGGVPSAAVTTKTPGSGGVPSAAVTTKTPGSGGVPSAAVTTKTPGSGGVPSAAVTTKTPGSGGVPSAAVTTKTPGSGGVPSAAVTTKTPGSGGVPSAAVTTKTPGSGGVPSAAVTTKTPGSGGVPSAAVTTKTPGSGGVPSAAVTTKTPGSGGVPSAAVTTKTPGSDGVPSAAVTTKTPGSGGVPSAAVTTTTPGSGGPSTTPITPTTAPDSCTVNPCGLGSTCAVRADQAFVCLCSLGDSYNYEEKACVNAKVFPGQLFLQNLKYQQEMEDKKSKEFYEAAKQITDELKTVFSKDGISNATVLSLQKRVVSRVGSEGQDGVTASIEIIFSMSSNITTSDITSKLKNAPECPGCLLGNASFEVINMCKEKPCDEATTTCSSVKGYIDCICDKTYIKTNFSNRICVACPSGQKAADSSSCVRCGFGRSGLNCTEHWKLALVIVGSVLGGLLLIALILLPILALRSSKKSTKKSKHEDIGKPYVSHFPTKSPLANGNGSFANSQAPSNQGSGFEGARMPRIPRATASSNWDRRANLEMTPSNSRQNLVPIGSNSRLYDDEDDMSSYTRPQSNYYAPARPRSDPYAQSRPQNNPYAPSQGQNNPCYQQNNEKW